MVVIKRTSMISHFIKKLKDQGPQFFLSGRFFGKMRRDLAGNFFGFFEIIFEFKILIVQPGNEEGRAQQIN